MDGNSSVKTKEPAKMSKLTKVLLIVAGVLLAAMAVTSLVL